MKLREYITAAQRFVFAGAEFTPFEPLNHNPVNRLIALQ